MLFFCFFRVNHEVGFKVSVKNQKPFNRQLSFVCCFEQIFLLKVRKCITFFSFFYSEVFFFFGVFLIQESSFFGWEKSFFISFKLRENNERQKSILLKLLVKLRENTCKHHTALGSDSITYGRTQAVYNNFIILRDATSGTGWRETATAFLLNETRFRAEKSEKRRNYCLFCWFNEPFIRRKVIIKNIWDVIWLQKFESRVLLVQ